MKIRNKHWEGEFMVLDIINNDGNCIGELRTENSKFIRAINEQDLNKITLRFIEDKKTS